MKQILSQALLCLALAGAAIAQPQPAPAAPPASPSGPSSVDKASTASPLHFDLDFKGGSIRALFDAMGTARGKPVNVYLPRGGETIVISPFHVTGVTVEEVLEAISISSGEQASRNSHDRALTYEFFAVPAGSDSALWSLKIFDARSELTGAPLCRVYSLSPYLEAGLSVDDITTAIRTAWKMLNYNPPTANLSYHRETKLLIAVVPEQELLAVEQVLGSLPRGPKKTQALAPTEGPKVPAAKL